MSRARTTTPPAPTPPPAETSPDEREAPDEPRLEDRVAELERRVARLGTFLGIT